MTFKEVYKKHFLMRYVTNYIVIAAALLVLVGLNLAGVLGKGDRSTLTRIGFSMILAVSLNLVVGFLGELSLGHAGFMCVGAYLGGFLSNALNPILGNSLISLIICMIAGGVIAGLFGLVIGIPALRLKGDYLAITTLAFGEIVRNVFKNLSFFGGAKGLSCDLYDSKSLFVVAFIVLLFVVFVSQNFIRSKHGRAVTAIRDNEIAARAMGINVTFYKLLIFALAAFFAGVAGVLYAKCIGTVRQENFDYNYSIEILVMVVLGGMGSINGSMIAAAVITYVNILLQNNLSGSLAPIKLIAYAAILIFMILYNNAPMFANLRNKLDVKQIMARMSKKAPDSNKEREDESAWHRIKTKINMDELLSADVHPNDQGPIDPDYVERGGK